MDFVTGLPLSSSKKNVEWVIFDRLRKSPYFIAVRTDWSLQKLVEVYTKEIVRLHDVPMSIISDRDPWFTASFLKQLHKFLGTGLNFSTGWERYLPLVDFVYNNSFQSSIQMAPYEVLYSRRCRTPVCSMELGEKRMIGPELIQETKDIVKKIGDKLKTAFDRNKSYSDLKHRDIEYSVGDAVFINVSP
ncbi:uncharacterized protein [Gossypium hirsutum]|uniref:DNA/RNA polymerases superfamily protein n=1 Tax=Gossypium hirsutum TaxID=3635 RepID=A0A1U8JJI4_GOSHI|nr:uncharacterized protein LOC107907562 [Gossypium hirsutum]